MGAFETSFIKTATTRGLSKAAAEQLLRISNALDNAEDDTNFSNAFYGHLDKSAQVRWPPGIPTGTTAPPAVPGTIQSAAPVASPTVSAPSPVQLPTPPDISPALPSNVPTPIKPPATATTPVASPPVPGAMPAGVTAPAPAAVSAGAVAGPGGPPAWQPSLTSGNQTPTLHAAAQGV